MIYLVLNKKKLVFGLAILILIVVTTLTIIISSANSPFYIIIDPGHGGKDSGAIGIGKVLEKDLNLDVALNLRDFFQSAGYNTIMTRETDDDTDGSESFNKTQDILKRASYTVEYPNSIYISIHMNSSGSSNDKGFQVFYGWINKDSKNLAQSVYNVIKKSEIINRLREVKKSPETVYIFKKVTVPAVLIECGFIRNKEDFALLNDAEYRKTLAFILFCGIAEYINN